MKHTCLLLLLLGCVAATRRMDLMMRAHSPDFALMLPLFRSFELFFPMELLGQFFVVLDEGSLDDAGMALLMPNYVTVVYEPLAHIKTPLQRVHGVTTARGYFGQQVSKCFFDRYGTSEFIGIMDTDAVFRTGNMESLLFRDDNPVMFCTQHRDMGMEGVRRLYAGFDVLNPFSCAETFPFMFRRDSFPKLRAFVAEQMGMANQHEALVSLFEDSAHIMALGEFALMGSYAYLFERERYHFVIGGNGPLSTCPEIRPCMHVHYGSPHWRQHENQKVHPEYFDTARLAMARGVCHMSCNQSETCAAIVAKDPFDEELLSLESTHEMMFGRLENLRMPHCLKHTVRRLKRHRKALRQQACSLASQSVFEKVFQ